MTNTTCLAVLVATHNRPQLLAQRALTAIQRQTRWPEYLVVVDDSEPQFRPDNRDVVNDMRIAGCRIVYRKNVRTPGAAGAWNTGLDWLRRHAGPSERVHVAILDDDDEWECDHLEACHEAAMLCSLDMVATAIIRHSESQPPLTLKPPDRLTADDFLVGNPHIQGSSLFVRLSHLLEAGAFDESLPSCTDRDICIRLADLGHTNYAALTTVTVRHYAEASRKRLSSAEGPAKHRGLDRFWFKWHGRMTDEQRSACLGRAKQLFDWEPPLAPSAPPVVLGGMAPPPSDRQETRIHSDDLVLVVGIIADDAHCGQADRLLSDLLELQESDQICCLDVVVLQNDDADAELRQLVEHYRRSGLTVFLASQNRQIKDAGAGNFGHGFERPPGRAPIGPARTMLQAYVGAVVARRPGAIAWILDDDSRLLHPSAAARNFSFRSLLPSLASLRQRDVQVVLGTVTGDPPVPPGSCVRTQLVDLYHNLAWMAQLDPRAPLPDRSHENSASRASARDYYYDLSRRDTSHLETPFWLTPDTPNELAGDAFMRMLNVVPRILAGQGVFRPLVADTAVDCVSTICPSVKRGSNTFVFDCAAFTDFPNFAPQFSGTVLRRSDMIWALLNRYAGGRRIVQAVLPVQHDRSDEEAIGLDLDRLVPDIRGYALFSALEDVLVRRRSHRLQQGVGAETSDDLRFDDVDIELAVSRFGKYLRERTAALLLSCWRVQGLCHTLLRVTSRSLFPSAPFHEDARCETQLNSLAELIQSIQKMFDVLRVEKVVARIQDVLPDEVTAFLTEMRHAVARHRRADKDGLADWVRSERRASAEALARHVADGDSVVHLGSGSEGVVFATRDRVIKVIDYAKRSAANGTWQGLEQLIASGKAEMALHAIEMLNVPAARVVISYPFEDGKPYTGGRVEHVVQLLRECRNSGIVTTNFHPKNLLTTCSAVRLVDYGSDIRPHSSKLYRSMLQRAFLTIRFHDRDDLADLMRSAIRNESIVELEGWQSLIAAIDPPSKRELVDGMLVDTAESLLPKRVLDYGCGHGRVAAALAERRMEVVAFDVDHSMAARWRRVDCGRADAVTWRSGSPDSVLPTLTGGFDLVICSLVLCVLDDEDEYRAALHGLAAAVGESGTCLILLCNPATTLDGDTTLQTRDVPEGAEVDRKFIWTKRLPSGTERRDVHRPLGRVLADLSTEGLHLESASAVGGLAWDSLLPSSDFLLLKVSRAKPALSRFWIAPSYELGAQRDPLDVPVLCYHRILPEDYSDGICELQRARGTVVDTDVFARQLDDLLGCFVPISLAEYAEWLNGRPALPLNACLVTFDDGYRDFLGFALPLLNEREIPSVLFATRCAATGESLLPVDQLYTALHAARQRGEISDVELRDWLMGAKKRAFVHATSEQQAEMMSAAGLMPAFVHPSTLYLNESELVGLMQERVSLGAHGLRHEVYEGRDLAWVRKELRQAKIWLENLLMKQEKQPVTIAYPNGSFDDIAVGATIESGFHAAFTVLPFEAGKAAHRWTLRRSCIPNRASAIRELSAGMEVRI